MGNVRKIYKIFVYNLPWTVSQHELKTYFNKYGAIVSFNKKTGLSKGYGFIEFIDKETFDIVLQQPSHIIDNYNIKVREYSSIKKN
ncbi:hypothetical protein V1478_013450 [Vespula squamosa]|uniref:RRM domain-containing protein n=1 Tax=Vespula squamosa TaxID=30214 RepID=A0ABD2AB21_VESSQ